MPDIFEKGKMYTFYFSSEEGGLHFTGEIISFEFPLVKVETEGLTRVINCRSNQFVEAVARREDDEATEPGESR